MASQMKAAVFQGPGRLVTELVPIPEIGPRDVLVKVRTCGICGSDLHSYKLGAYVKPGQILGHEFLGEVAAVGAEVQGIAEGERVTGGSSGICGQCCWCRQRQYALCPNLFKRSTGYGLPGAMAEYVKIERAKLGATVRKVPPEIDDETGATIEPVSVGTYTVAHAGVKEGDKVVVLGAGLIGNACMQAAKVAGAAQVVVIEVSAIRIDAARLLGADAVFDARTGDALEWVKEVVGVSEFHFGEGGAADVVIEAAGVPSTIQQSFDMVRSGGTIAFVALPEKLAPIDTSRIVYKQPRILGMLGGDLAKSTALLASGEIRTKPLITHQFPLEEAAAAFEKQMRSDEAIKVIFKM